MSFESDLYGNVYKSQKTKNAAAKQKATNEAKKQMQQNAYNQAFERDAQTYAKKNNISGYSAADLGEAARAYYGGKKEHQKFLDWSNSESASRNRAELKSHASFATDHQSEIDEYNAARKKMNMQPDNMVTKKKYDQMFGYDTKKGTDNGMFNRYQDYITSKDLKVNHNDKAARKGGLSSDKKLNFFEKIEKNHPVLDKILTFGMDVKHDDKKEDKTHFGTLNNNNIGKNYANNQLFNIPSLIEEKITGAMPSYLKDEKARKTGEESSHVQDNINLALGGLAGIGKTSAKQLLKNVISKKGIGTALGGGVFGGIAGELQNKYQEQLGNDLSTKDEIKNILTNTAMATAFGKLLGGHTKMPEINKVSDTDILKAASEKGVKKSNTKNILEAVNRLAEKNKANELPDISSLPKNHEGLYLIKDEYPMQTKMSLQKANETIKNGVQPTKQTELIKQIDESPKLQNEINQMNKEHIASYGNSVKEPTHMNIDAAPNLDPTTAPLHELPVKPTPINHDLPYKPGDPLPDLSKQVVSKTNLPLTEKLPTKENIIQQTIDNIHTFKKADKLANNTHADESMYKVGLNGRGSDMIAHHVINDSMVNKHGEVVGESLKQALEGLPKGKEKEFQDYLVAKHSITRMKRGEKVYADNMEMNIPKARAIIRKMQSENPEFQKLSKKFYNYQKNLERTWAVDTGLMSKEDYESMTAANPFYVSNQRILPKSERSKAMFNRGGKNKFSNQSADVKKGKGSQLQIVNPIESTIERTDKLIKVSKQNEAMQVLAKNIIKDPGSFDGFARIVPEKELDANRISKLHIKDLDQLTDDFSEQFERSSKKSDGNIFYFMKDGKKQYLELHDPDFVKAVANLEPHTRDVVTRNVGKVTNLFKVFVTGNPVFALTKNVWKDIPQAYANSYTTHNPLKFSKDIVTSFFDILTNSKNYKDFKAIGGGHSSSIAADRNLLKQSVRQVTNQKGITSKLSGVKEKMEDFNNAIESAPRLAEYKRVMQEYNKLKSNPSAKTKVLKPGVTEYGAKQQGLYEANDITLNFKKHGNVAKTADAYIPYLNASIQGLDKMARTFARNPVKYSAVTGAKAFTAISLPTILLYAINHDNPKYQELSDHVKDNYMLIPMDNGDKFTKIPVPRELGPFFKAGVERTLRQMADNDPEAWKHYADTIMTAFAPPVRSIFAPIGDVRANKDFQDAPIVPGSIEGKSPKYQYDGKTSEPSKLLGRMMNYSPKKIDYLAKSYTGVLAQFGQPMTTESNTVGDMAKNIFVADPTFSNDYQRDFYDLKTKIDQQYTDYKAGDRKTAPDNALRKWLNDQNKKMSDERKLMRTALVDKTLTREERSKKVKEIQEKINQLANLKNRK